MGSKESIKLYWAQITKDMFLGQRDYWGAFAPTAPSTLRIPGYYTDPSGNATAKTILEIQTSAALYWALRYKLTGLAEDGYRAGQHLIKWGITTTNIEGRETEFQLIYEGHKFIQALDYLGDFDWNKVPFQIWLHRVYQPIAKKFALRNTNNQGAWGWCGYLRSQKHLGGITAPMRDAFLQHVLNAIDAQSQMKYEIKRTNSALWYINFALAPYARVMFDLLEEDYNLFGFIEKTLDWYFQYCLEPESWPYRLPTNWLARWLTQLVYPCSDTLEIPKPNDWPANLLEALATRVFDKPEW